MTHCRITILTWILIGAWALAESQENDYKGINDPFGDPANYEFAEDEKADKEFFHLGRFLMFGADMGAGIFTFGLGRSAGSGVLSGARLVYFFDQHIGFEAAVHYAFHTDIVQTTGGGTAILDTQIIPVTGSIRFYFDTKNTPRSISIANPYAVFGAGNYVRTIKNGPNSNFIQTEELTYNFGLNLGGGLEFNIYRRHIFLGVDVRYHWIWFQDEENGIVANSGLKLVSPDNRSGDYISGLITLSYSF